MTETRNYTTDKYGNFSIEEFPKKGSLRRFLIWWDFYDEQEYEPMETDGDFIEWFTPGCDVKDFSDLPEGGYFSSFEKAEEYLRNKFGEIK
jgi:hypothetical protein